MKGFALAIALVVAVAPQTWGSSSECAGDCYKECKGNYSKRFSDFFDFVLLKQACERFAREGNAEAQIILGMLHEEGWQGLTPDYGNAAKWFRMAAEQGYPDAQWWLATLYVRGEGVLQNYAEAIKWLQRAAEQGFDFAPVGPRENVP